MQKIANWSSLASIKTFYLLILNLKFWRYENFAKNTKVSWKIQRNLSQDRKAAITSQNSCQFPFSNEQHCYKFFIIATKIDNLFKSPHQTCKTIKSQLKPSHDHQKIPTLNPRLNLIKHTKRNFYWNIFISWKWVIKAKFYLFTLVSHSSNKHTTKRNPH